MKKWKKCDNSEEALKFCCKSSRLERGIFALHVVRIFNTEVCTTFNSVLLCSMNNLNIEIQYIYIQYMHEAYSKYVLHSMYVCHESAKVTIIGPWHCCGVYKNGLVQRYTTVVQNYWHQDAWHVNYVDCER